MTKFKLLSLLVLPVLLFGAAPSPAQAANFRDYWGYGNPYATQSGAFFYNHPYVQKAVLVGGAGAAIGAVTAPDGYRAQGAAKGALLGAGAGMGYELLRERGVIPW